MFCESCGTRLADGARFCESCGQPTPGAGTSQQRNAPTPPVSSAPFVIAGSLHFLWAATMMVMVALQLSVGALTANTQLQIFGAVNTAVAIGYIVIGVGVMNKNRRAFQWAVGTNLLNAIGGLYQIFALNGYLNLFLLPMEITIIAIVVSNRSAVEATRGLGRVGAGKRVRGGVLCPVCGLVSPTSAEHCDCGFTFEQASASSRSQFAQHSTTPRPVAPLRPLESTTVPNAVPLSVTANRVTGPPPTEPVGRVASVAIEPSGAVPPITPGELFTETARPSTSRTRMSLLVTGVVALVGISGAVGFFLMRSVRDKSVGSRATLSTPSTPDAIQTVSKPQVVRWNDLPSCDLSNPVPTTHGAMSISSTEDSGSPMKTLMLGGATVQEAFVDDSGELASGDVSAHGLDVSAWPTCADPRYLFIEEFTGGSDPHVSDSFWLLTLARWPTVSGPSTVFPLAGDFPLPAHDDFGDFTALTFTDKTLTAVTTNASRRSERSFTYLPLWMPSDGLSANGFFLDTKVPLDQYRAVIGVSNDDFFEHVGPPVDALQAAMGRARFDDLHGATGLVFLPEKNLTHVVDGRWLVIAGRQPHNVPHHGLVLMDMLTNRQWTIICDDWSTPTGQATVTGPVSQEELDSRLLWVFGRAGFDIVVTDDGALHCAVSGCHVPSGSGRK